MNQARGNMSHMQNMVQRIVAQGQRHDPVSQKEYQQWQDGYVFDALRGLNYGHSFCQQFGIVDYRLMFSPTQALSDQIIQRDWVRRHKSP